MKLKLLLSALIFFFSIKLSAQIPVQIEKTASDVIIAVFQNKSLPADEVNAIYTFYNSDPDMYEFEKNYDTNIASFDSLRNYITGLRRQFNNITNDSALVLLNQYYLRISNTFYNYFTQRAFSSTKAKIIFFSASVSCPCTLEMCKNQLVDILKFKKDNNDRFDWLVIDSYMNNELQIKYETYFSPSVLIFNGKNQVINKIEYDENMIKKLTDFLTAKDKAGGI